MNPEPNYLYVVVHEACANRLGVLASQVAHASSECIRQVPVPSDTRACILKAPTSAKLEEVSASLTAAGVDHVLIREPDPPWNGAATALGVLCPRARVKPLMASLELLR